MSDHRMNSCRLSSVMSPVSVALAISSRHSSSLSPTSTAKRVEMTDERLHQFSQAGIGSSRRSSPARRR